MCNTDIPPLHTLLIMVLGLFNVNDHIPNPAKLNSLMNRVHTRLVPVGNQGALRYLAVLQQPCQMLKAVAVEEDGL